MSAARSFDAGAILPHTFSSRADSALSLSARICRAAIDRHVGARNRSLLDRVEQCVRPRGAGRERLHRVELLLGGELRVRLEDRGGRLGVRERGQPADRAPPRRPGRRAARGASWRSPASLRASEQFDRGAAVVGLRGRVGRRASSSAAIASLSPNSTASASASRRTSGVPSLRELRDTSRPSPAAARQLFAPGERVADAAEDVDAGDSSARRRRRASPSSSRRASRRRPVRLARTNRTAFWRTSGCVESGEQCRVARPASPVEPRLDGVPDHQHEVAIGGLVAPFEQLPTSDRLPTVGSRSRWTARGDVEPDERRLLAPTAHPLEAAIAGRGRRLGVEQRADTPTPAATRRRRHEQPIRSLGVESLGRVERPQRPQPPRHVLARPCRIVRSASAVSFSSFPAAARS